MSYSLGKRPSEPSNDGNLPASRRQCKEGARLTSGVGKTYVLLERLGSGAFSDVWRAEDENKQPWAIKVLKTTGDGPVETETELVEAFNREREMLELISQLRCPHLTQLRAAFVDGNTHCIVMDLAEMGSLEHIMSVKRGDYSIDDVIKWARHLALALHALASAPGHPIVHADLSLRNLLLTARGDLLLSDLGISMLLRRAGLSLAPIFQPNGPHVAPEVRILPNNVVAASVLHEKLADHKLDMWSYGYCLYLLALKLVGQSDAFTTDYIDAIAARDDVESDLHKKLTSTWGTTADDSKVVMLAKVISSTLNPRPGSRMSAEETLRVLSSTGPWRDLLPPIRADLVLRQAPLQQLKAAVLTGEPSGTAAAGAALSARSTSGVVVVSGMPGVGKSTLARQLIEDTDVAAHFPDGIVWLVFGNGSGLNLLEKQSLLYLHILGQPPAPSFQSLDQGRLTLLRVLRDRACLLVADDVWEQPHADALDVLGPKGLLLITSRIETVMANRAHRVKLPTLDDDIARQMLASYAGLCAPSTVPAPAGRDTASLPPAALAVLKVCKGLPLAIAIVGALMRGLEGLTWEEVLEHAKLSGNAASFLQGLAYDGLSSNSGLYGALEASLSRLQDFNPQAATCLNYYAAWVEDARMPIGLAGRIWGLNTLTTRLVLKCLNSWSLIELNERQDSNVHDILRDFLRFRLSSHQLAELHATTLTRGCGDRKVLALHGIKAELSSTWLPADRHIHDSFWHHVTGMGPAGSLAAETLKQVLRPVEQLQLKRYEGSEAAVEGPMEVLLSCVGSSPALQTLDLRDFDLPLSCMKAVASSLAQPGACPSLKCIFLSNLRQTVDTATALGEVLQKPGALPMLTRLTVISDGMGPEAMEALIPIKGPCWAPTLTDLILEDIEVGNTAAHCVAHLLEQGGLPNLEQLCLNMNGMGDDGCRRLCRAIGSSPAGERLQHLELVLNDIGDGGFYALAEMLPSMPRLACLGAHGNYVTAMGLRSLLNAVSHPASAPTLTQISAWPRATASAESKVVLEKLGELMYQRRPEGKSGVAELRAFEENEEACELKVHGCADGAGLISNLLESRGFTSAISARLRHVRLAYCGLGDDGACRLMDALVASRPCGLEVLYLEGNGMSETAALAVSKWMADPSCSRRLRNLDLSDNPLGDRGAKALADALTSGGEGACASLQNLLLHFTAFSTTGAKAILHALASPRRFEALRWVDLRYNDSADDVLEACEELVGGRPLVCPSLNLLMLQGNAMTTATMAKLHAICEETGVRTNWKGSI